MGVKQLTEFEIIKITYYQLGYQKTHNGYTNKDGMRDVHFQKDGDMYNFALVKVRDDNPGVVYGIFQMYQYLDKYRNCISDTTNKEQFIEKHKDLIRNIKLKELC